MYAHERKAAIFKEKREIWSTSENKSKKQKNVSRKIIVNRNRPKLTKIEKIADKHIKALNIFHMLKELVRSMGNNLNRTYRNEKYSILNKIYIV